MCSGRVDLDFILRAFHKGLDGVIIGGCLINDCNYDTDGNFGALNTVLLAKKLLAHMGINPDRLSIKFMTSGDGNLFADIMSDFGNQIKALGPLGSEGLDQEEIDSKLTEIRKLVPYIKLEYREKLASRLEDPATYEELFTAQDIIQLLDQVKSYYIVPDKCQACTICARRCPVDAIISARNQIHVIDQDKCIKCGNCVTACPPRFDAVATYAGEAVPPAIPESERMIEKKSKTQ